MDFLDGTAKIVATQVIREEETRRKHVVIALSGAHAYGFPSPDSDLDLKAIHIGSTKELLGLGQVDNTVDRLEVIDGVEIDYTSNEIGSVLAGVLAGNGNYIERILGTLIAQSSSIHRELVPLVQSALSQRVYHHYRGFAANQRKAFEHAETPKAKKLLYVLRTALTGAHLLRTGQLCTNLNNTATEYGFPEAAELIEEKKRGEGVCLALEQAQTWNRKLDQLFQLLQDSLSVSCLPAEPPNQARLDEWLVETRVKRLEQYSAKITLFCFLQIDRKSRAFHE